MVLPPVEVQSAPGSVVDWLVSNAGAFVIEAPQAPLAIAKKAITATANATAERMRVSPFRLRLVAGNMECCEQNQRVNRLYSPPQNSVKEVFGTGRSGY
jgi:hypothetical protein